MGASAKMCKGESAAVEAAAAAESSCMETTEPAPVEKTEAAEKKLSPEEMLRQVAETRRKLRETLRSCEKTSATVSNTLTLTHETMEKYEYVKDELGKIIDKQAERLMTQLGAACQPEEERRPCDKWHGREGNEMWAEPRCVAKTEKLAREGYTRMDASEYLDTPEVLHAKVAMLAEMIRHSRELTAYTGAGLSTSAGVADYASHAKGS